MKSVAIFRHFPTEGPGYFATFLDRHQIPWNLIKVDEGDTIPPAPWQFSGLVFMGGPMSVNDKLPWIPPLLGLIRDAVAVDIPVLGHCLGAQLMAKALGGTVNRNPDKEIGWGTVSVAKHAIAREWFGGNLETFLSFHWHGETFTLPQGATRILSSDYCVNQGFALGGNLGLQCHIEMTEDMIKTWCHQGRQEIQESRGPAVQSVENIQTDLMHRTQDLNAIADKIYTRWIQGLKR